MRIQFYPSADLENELLSHSKSLGVNISSLVVDILNKHYGLIPPNSLSDIEIEKKVFDELKEYVKKASTNDEFDLNKASATYTKIDMVYAGKPLILKAKLGRKFAKIVGSGDFTNVVPVYVNGKIKRTVGNRAAIYKIK